MKVCDTARPRSTNPQRWAPYPVESQMWSHMPAGDEDLAAVTPHMARGWRWEQYWGEEALERYRPHTRRSGEAGGVTRTPACRRRGTPSLSCGLASGAC